jgi:hypothetical protein
VRTLEHSFKLVGYVPATGATFDELTAAGARLEWADAVNLALRQIYLRRTDRRNDRWHL